MAAARALILLLMVAVGAMAAEARAAPIAVVAAENFYGNVARQIGGAHVRVTSVLANPNEDPHLFAASPSAARAVAAARIVVYNGIGYDSWMVRLLAGSPSAGRGTIEVARLMHRKPGDNPHLWYDPETMPRYAMALAALLERDDPAHRADYQRNLAAFQASLVPLDTKIATMRTKYHGVAVTATEPVFGYMASALLLNMRDRRFQLAVMNGTEPGASDLAHFETDLRQHRVRVLLYNDQTEEALTSKMKTIANAAGIPVVGVSETEPAGKGYQTWMMDQLSALDAALMRSR
ncbi:MAG: metal ABC transporter solute-binding protein, Zn/Mn family [Stellaceae bacterium]